MVEHNIVEEFIDAVKQEPVDKNHTYSAQVSRIDKEGTVWVYVAGSDIETPTASASAEVQRGDYVTVEWRNNSLYIAGNSTNPAVGTTRVTAVETAANLANTAAQNAVRDAGVAKDAAESAQSSASAAQSSADAAELDAQSANESARSALANLGFIEDIIGVLDLLQKNGKYEPTTDPEVESGKWYFTKNELFELTTDEELKDKTYYTRSGAGTEQDPYIYTPVENPVVEDLPIYYEDHSTYSAVIGPTGDPSAQGWYELVDIDESIRNYVSSHLVLTDSGLFLQQDGINSKLGLDANGVTIYGPDGLPMAQYGTTAQIGEEEGFHIKIDGTELGFYQADNKVAYINNNQLYITKSVVLQQMDLGTPVADDGLGQWSWKVHENAQGLNNLNLKWIG